MKITIKLKPFFLTRALWIVILVGFALSLMLFLLLAFDLTTLYALSMFMVFIGLLIAFYLNRNDPEVIEVNENELKAHFFNKIFFKRKPIVASINDLRVKKNENAILLFEKRKALQIRKRSVTLDDWNLLVEYFEKFI
jgi:hypothetical protein